MNTNNYPSQIQKVRIACYLRVSSEQQKRDGYGREVQLEAMKRYIYSNGLDGWEFDENMVYEDLAISGVKSGNDRAGYSRLQEDIINGKIDIVLGYSISRLARNVKELLTMVEFFDENNVTFRAIKEPIDTSNRGMGRFFLTVLGAMAEMERQMIIEKCYEGKLQAIKDGRYVFGNPPYGFDKDEQKNLIPNIEEQKIVKSIFDMYVCQNKSTTQITKILSTTNTPTSFDTKYKRKRQKHQEGKWTQKMICKILSNETYIGTCYINKHMPVRDKKGNAIPGKRTLKDKSEWLSIETEPIIDINTFNRAQKKLGDNKYIHNNHNKPVEVHTFAGLCKCGICGSTYKGYRQKKGKMSYVYYRCTKKSSLGIGKERCNNIQIPEAYLKQDIYSYINDLIKNPKNIIEKHVYSGIDQENLNKWQAEICSCNEKKEELMRKWKDASYSMMGKQGEQRTYFETLISDFEKQIEIVEARKRELEENIRIENEKIDKEKQVLNLHKFLSKCNIRKWNKELESTIIHTLVKSIKMKPDNIEVCYYLPIDPPESEKTHGGNIDNGGSGYTQNESKNNSTSLPMNIEEKRSDADNFGLSVTGYSNLVEMARFELASRKAQIYNLLS